MDSFYKSRKPENGDTFGEEKEGKLYRVENDQVIELGVNLGVSEGDGGD